MKKNDKVKANMEKQNKYNDFKSVGYSFILNDKEKGANNCALF
ncbi:hypothetical protein OSB94_09945 [Proteus vulgaris]|nr:MULTISPECIES: hypothetical protein [Proteus]MDS0788412.1 hypothetical protein [Proteus vulgaris]